MGQEITLSGGQMTLLKRIGLSGGQVYGKLLVSDVEKTETAEFLETLLELIDEGYILSNKVNIRLIEDVGRAFFRANPVHLVELRDAMHPSRKRERERSADKPIDKMKFARAEIAEEERSEEERDQNDAFVARDRG